MIYSIQQSINRMYNTVNHFIIMAYRTDFDEFVKYNGINQRELAGWLNVSETFVSRLATGKAKCPADKMKALERMAKEKGWDMTMFHRSKQQANDNGTINNSQGGIINNISSVPENEEVSGTTVFATLLKQLEKKDAQIETLIGRLMDLTEKLISVQDIKK